MHAGQYSTRSGPATIGFSQCGQLLMRLPRDVGRMRLALKIDMEDVRVTFLTPNLQSKLGPPSCELLRNPRVKAVDAVEVGVDLVGVGNTHVIPCGRLGAPLLWIVIREPSFARTEIAHQSRSSFCRSSVILFKVSPFFIRYAPVAFPTLSAVYPTSCN